MFTNYINFM